MQRVLSLILLAVVVMLLATSAVAAQEDAIVSGLNSPRGVTYDSEGNLYVIQAGNGGPLTSEGPFGPVEVGGTGALTRVNPEGRAEILIQNLASQGPSRSARGAQDVLVTETSIWLLIGETPTDLPLSHVLVELDREHLRIQTVVDLFSIEAEQNPDGDIISSNPTSFAMTDDGRFYIANAGCNCIQTWAEGSEVEIFTFWSIDDNPVPTSVALGQDNDLYVGFLSGFPFPEEQSRIERWSLDGELLETFGGLTAIVDVLMTEDGTLYAVQHGVFSDSGWAAGRVIRVSADGVETVLDGLNRPWGLAVAPDGGLVVSINSTSTDGAVIRVPMS